MSKHEGFSRIGSAVFYGFISTSMAFLNKAVINSYEFNFPFFIMACQMLMTVIFIEILCSLNRINLPPYSLKAAKGFLAPSIGYAMHAVLSLIALEGMNIPMYTAIKRCAPLVNLILAVVILRRPFPSCGLTTSIVIITAGCIIAVLGDVSFEKYTYFMGIMSVLAQAIYLTLVQKHSENQISTLEILQLNSYNTLAPFIILSIGIGESTAIFNNKYLADPGFYLTFVTLVSLGAVLNYSLFLCTALNSALTTSLVGVAKSVIQTLVGFFVFGGVQFHPLNLTGILLNMVGGFVYSYIKFVEQKNMKENYDNHKDEVESKVFNNFNNGNTSGSLKLQTVNELKDS